MPNRILRPWQDSFRINQLSDQAELFFVRLIMTVDDFGRFHAHPALLRANLFPLRIERIPEKSVEKWRDECAAAGLFYLFEYKGQKFLEINKFNQRTRQQSSRFPSVTDADRHDDRQDVSHNGSHSAHGDGGGDERGDGDEVSVQSSGKADSGQKSEKVAMEFPCKGKPDRWPLPEKKITEWQESFPGVDVKGECRKARQWLKDNPTRGKTAKGMTRFLYGWLERCQNKGGGRSFPDRNAPPTPDPLFTSSAPPKNWREIFGEVFLPKLAGEIHGPSGKPIPSDPHQFAWDHAEARRTGTPFVATSFHEDIRKEAKRREGSKA